MGRLISKSEGIGVIVTGAIERQGNGYAVTVRAINPSDEKRSSRRPGQPPPTRAGFCRSSCSLADEVRRALGDTMPSVAAGETFTAASLDAMRAFARAQELQRANRFERGTRANISARSISTPASPAPIQEWPASTSTTSVSPRRPLPAMRQR